MTNPQANWGGFEWGDAYWGAGAPASADVQGEQSNALQSTRILGLSSTPETDLSQYSTDLTAQSNGAYETSSARGAITAPRTIYVRTSWLIGTDKFTLAAHHDSTLANYTYLMEIGGPGSGLLRLYDASGLLFSITVTDFATSAQTEDISIQWATRENPDTTGASDIHISEITVYNHSTSTWSHYEQFTHATATTNVAWTQSVGGWWSGAVWSTDAPSTIEKWRIDNAYLSTVHMAAHWVGGRSDTAPSEVVEKAEPLFLDKASGVGDQNEWTGSQLQYGLDHQSEARYKLLSPLVNEVYGDGATDLDNTYAPANWHKKPPGSSVYRWSIAWLRWIPVPKNCNYIWTKVQVKSTVSSGDSVPIGIRVYSMNRLPTVGGLGDNNNEPPAFEKYFTTEVLDADHTTSSGEWVVEGLVKVARLKHPEPKFNDTTHLCIAYSIDPASASANDAAETLIVQAWQAWPVSHIPGGDNPGPGGQVDMG